MGILGKLAKDLNEVDKAVERRKQIPALTLDKCIILANEERKKYPQITAFLIKVENLGSTDAEGLKILVAYLDRDHRAITEDGTTGLTASFLANRVDDKIITLLNGEDSAIYEL